ncbi:MAG: hypothetical protein ACRDRV_16970 [Pseudonocardiaceae bacterium]
MSNTAKWVAGISGTAVAGISIIYFGVGMLLRSYPADSAELEDGDDGLAGGFRARPMWATEGEAVNSTRS